MAFSFDTISSFFLPSALGKLTANFTRTKDEFAKVLYRDGSSFMTANLDMNSKRLLNLGPGISATDAATVGQLLTVPQGPKGDAGGNVMAIGSFGVAPTLSIPVGSDLVQTSGYAANGVGAALYTYDASVNSAYVTANPRSSFISANGRGFRLIVRDGVNVAWFGAAGDNTDQTDAFEAALLASLEVFVPVGTYQIVRPLPLRPGQIVRGPTSGLTPAADRAIIQNLVVGGGCFWYTNDNSTADVRGPEIHNLYLNADYPIRFNNENLAVVGDSTGNVPAITRPVVKGCNIDARVQGVGRGISWTKCFDGEISFNRIGSFDTNILLNGCDLNVVQHNRSLLANSYHVLEISINSFGSQNEICHNDMLYVNTEAGKFIRSSARHVRIYNNYIEQGSAYASAFDLSTTGSPTFNGQPLGVMQSVSLRDNRIDGQQYATGGVYRVQTGSLVSGRIEDVGTSATLGGSGLVLLDAAGNGTDELPILFNQTNATSFVFKGPRFGSYDGFSSGQCASLEINNRNLWQFGLGLFTNNASDYLRSNPLSIVFKNGFGSVAELRYPANYLETNRLHVVEVIARAKSGTETLNISYLNPTGGSLNAVALTTEWKAYSFSFTTSGSLSDRQGVYFSRSNNGSDIEIRSIRLTPQR